VFSPSSLPALAAAHETTFRGSDQPTAREIPFKKTFGKKTSKKTLTELVNPSKKTSATIAPTTTIPRKLATEEKTMVRGTNQKKKKGKKNKQKKEKEAANKNLLLLRNTGRYNARAAF
jgi:hypothetical protein